MRKGKPFLCGKRKLPLFTARPRHYNLIIIRLIGNRAGQEGSTHEQEPEKILSHQRGHACVAFCRVSACLPGRAAGDLDQPAHRAVPGRFAAARARLCLRGDGSGGRLCPAAAQKEGRALCRRAEYDLPRRVRQHCDHGRGHAAHAKLLPLQTWPGRGRRAWHYGERVRSAQDIRPALCNGRAAAGRRLAA